MSANPPAPTWKLLAGCVVATAVLTGVVSAWANDQFDDVPASHPFHDDIAWLADTGITTGYSDGTFQPSRAVTRGSMAAFLRRAFDLQAGRVVTTTSAGTSTTSTAWADVPAASVTLTVPAGAEARIVASLSSQVGCEGGRPVTILLAAIAPGCRVRFLLDGVVMNPGVYNVAYSDLTQAQLDNSEIGDLLGQSEATTVMAASNLVGPGPHTVKVQWQTFNSTSPSADPVSFGLNNFLLTAEAHLADS